jgi:hypothetical protein
VMTFADGPDILWISASIASECSMLRKVACRKLYMDLNSFKAASRA